VPVQIPTYPREISAAVADDALFLEPFATVLERLLGVIVDGAFLNRVSGQGLATLVAVVHMKSLTFS
jgi:hypothetical protein